jgi:hypothetical protein
VMERGGSGHEADEQHDDDENTDWGVLSAVRRLRRLAIGATSSRGPNDVYRRTWRTAASQEGCQFPSDDKGKGKEISPLATINV